ncbi:MAG: nickel-dependent lactate racemase [bacterium]|nr:nickel-dependent lactate racemase [bacterium]
MRINYGSGEIELEIAESAFTRCLASPGSVALTDPAAALERGVTRLADRVREKRPQSVAIVVEDRTRHNPEWPEVLARLRSLLGDRCRLSLVVAYGTHPRHTREQHQQLYGAENVAAMQVVDHDSRDHSTLETVGRLVGGSVLRVNRAVVGADLVITLGNAAPHVFAGFTGGPKIILPGVCDYETIRANHSLVGAAGVGMGRLAGNPIHEQMAEAARLLGVDLSLQVVRDGRGRLCGVFAGEAEDAHARAVARCRQINTVVLSEPADVTWVSCGGSPKDNSLYHAQRAVTTAVSATRPGGVVVVFGSFPEGIGNRLFEQWLHKPLPELLNLPPAEIDIGIHSAYLMAGNLSRCSILWYSDLDQELARALSLTTISDIDSLRQTLARANDGDRDPVSYFIANGSSLLIDCEVESQVGTGVIDPRP